MQAQENRVVPEVACRACFLHGLSHGPCDTRDQRCSSRLHGFDRQPQDVGEECAVIVKGELGGVHAHSQPVRTRGKIIAAESTLRAPIHCARAIEGEGMRGNHCSRWEQRVRHGH